MTSMAPASSLVIVATKTFYSPRFVQHLAQSRGIAPTYRPPRGPGEESKLVLEAVEECARLRAELGKLKAENRRLIDENTLLRRGGVPKPGLAKAELIVRAMQQVERPSCRDEDLQEDDATTRLFSILDGFQ